MLAALALAFALQQAPAADSLRELAVGASDSVLTARARAAPVATREAVRAALRRGEGAIAERLAAAFAVAWQDSFYVREVARFQGWPRARQLQRLWADSVRLAGNAAFGREGAEVAIALWRSALARATALPDTALAAGLLGNIGAGFLRLDHPDSAAQSLNRATLLARLVGDQRVEANAVTALGDLARSRGDPATARAHTARALQLHERIGDTRGEAADRNNLGLLAQGVGDLAEARRHFTAALALNRADGRDAQAATNLVNLAALASLTGDFARADAEYREALALWRAQDASAEAADALLGLGQLALRRGDYVAAAEPLGEALAIYRAAGPRARELEARRLLATGRAAAGDLQGALDTLRGAEDQAGDAGGLARAGLVLLRADLALQLNAFAEAERGYARAADLYREAGSAAGEAEALHGQGVLALVREDYGEADARFAAALRVQLSAGMRRSAALTRLALAQADRRRGEGEAARAGLGRAVAELAQAGDPVGEAAARVELAELDLARGRPAAAEAGFRAADSVLDGRPAPEVGWRVAAGLAAARQARGDRDGAVVALRRALALAEQPRGTLALPERRAGFLADKWPLYSQLALLERARGEVGAAFDASEAQRAREMLELLGHGRIARPAGAPPDLVAREQDLRRQIATLTTALEGGDADALRGPAIVAEGGAVREAMLAAQEDWSALMLELRERAPRHAELVAPATAGWRAVAARLAPREAMVEYLVGDSTTLAFVLRRDTVAAVDLGLGRRELARLVAFARGTVEAPRPVTDSLWRGPFRRLHAHLVAPLEQAGLLADVSRLVLVPQAELHYLPFAALLGADGPLVTRYELTTTPSATVWLALGARAPGGGQGVLAAAPRPDALPASQREVNAVARLLPGPATVLTGAAASERAVLARLPEARVVHLATFGVLNKANPLFSFVEFAVEGGGAQRLEVHEVFGLSLRADLVVLSACQTGLASGRQADVPPGDDWVGLTRAFLHAGARDVVATLWAVQDRATADLMTDFYRHYAERPDPARALALAQRTLLRASATRHPFYWAGVALVGGAGAR